MFVPKSRADALDRVIAAQSAAKDTLAYKGVPLSPEGIEARQGMETRLPLAGNSLRSFVAEVIDGAKVYQGGGSERLEASLLDKVKEAANASLDHLFYDFKDADDHRWPKVIERARKGAEYPLEALDYSGKTEDHHSALAKPLIHGEERNADYAHDMATRINIQFYSDTPDALLKALLE